MAVYGISIEVPGVDESVANIRQLYGLRMLEGTGDAIKGPQDRLLNENARKYAAKYNQTVISSSPPETVSQPPLNCSLAASSKEEGVVIAWTTDVRETTQFGSGIKTETITVGPVRPIALLNGSLLKELSGAGMHKGQSFWRILSPKSKPLRLGSVGFLPDYMNDDHCVYFGSVENTKLPRWTLLSSAPLPGIFHVPTAKDRVEFNRLNRSCVQPGGVYPEGKAPPCVRPRLLAVSDLNKNGKAEYWATEPYMWDTGLTVWENSDTLVPLLQVCVGCSD